jgi:hypothetical protein
LREKKAYIISAVVMAGEVVVVSLSDGRWYKIDLHQIVANGIELPKD